MMKPHTPHERNLERIRRFTLMDDTFFNSCLMDSPGCAQLVLRVILDDESVNVRRVEIQSFIPNLEGRRIQSDAIIVDESGTLHCIEIQQRRDGANPKRPRYLSSMLDARSVRSGTDWRDIPPSNVIFITRAGMFGKEQPVCKFRRTMDETGTPLDDGSSIIYVDSSNKEDTPLGHLMQDFRCPDSDRMHYPELAERARYFKTTKEGISKMCEIMEEVRAEGREEGLLASVRSLMETLSLSVEQAMDALRIPPQDRDGLVKQL